MDIKELNEKDLCILTFPYLTASGSYYAILLNLIDILTPLGGHLTLITANLTEKDLHRSGIRLLNYEYKVSKNTGIAEKLIKYCHAQLSIAGMLIRHRKSYGKTVFVLSGTFLLPTIVGRLIGKTILLTAVVPESKNALAIHKRDRFGIAYLFYYLFSAMEYLNFLLASGIIVEAPHVASFMGLGKKNKIFPDGGFYVDLSCFKVLTSYPARKNVIGYVGRLSEEKGIWNFVRAIPLIIHRNPGMAFQIIGDGPLKSEIRQYLREHSLENEVSLLEWMDHDKLPAYLNEMKFLVIPSYTEGLPNILLESVGCGTIVLGTAVGGIPDVIVDGKTGFIIKQNTPEGIATTILAAVEYEDKQRMINEALGIVKSTYSYDGALVRYRKILQNLA